jgi:hypothetical protein
MGAFEFRPHKSRPTPIVAALQGEAAVQQTTSDAP